jgi:hypothetical protein
VTLRKKGVTLAEFPVLEGLTPLASGYLHAYATADSSLAADYGFHTFVHPATTSPDELTRKLVAQESDIYAFSCYVWNMRLIRKLVKELREARPSAHILLGGPQVMRHGDRYLDPSDSLTAICDGEGEETFVNYLRELGQPVPDLANVKGLTFPRDGELLTTPQQPRLTDLDTIPSPYLNGLFGSGYFTALMETNRGCPYHCGFCFWGAATNDRVYRFGEERIREEISWIARHNMVALYLTDANWGMLSRDVDFSQHVADCSREYGMPQAVYFSAAKNKPHAVTKIAEILQSAGLIATQPVSMQTLEERSLEIIARKNIKLNAFDAIQQNLHDQGISSFVELIWPLPGETLKSFQTGIGTLCTRGAQTILAYPHLMLHNTPLYFNRDQLGLVTRPAGDGAAEAEIVVQTPDVTKSDFEEGMRFFYASHALHDTHSLWATSRYLDREGICDYASLFAAFVSFWRNRSTGDEIVEFIERSIRDADYYGISNYGQLIYNTLHAHRDVFDRQLREFAAAQSWWTDPVAQAMFEIDLVGRPYVYANTPMDSLEYPFTSVQVTGRHERSFTVELDENYRDRFADIVRLESPAASTSVFTVDHQRAQHPHNPSDSLDNNGQYCHAMVKRIQNIIPVWRS